MCSVDEYEQGVIKRHELTREEKERDRIEHIGALGCQTGPIFLAHRDQPVLDMIVGAAKTSTPLSTRSPTRTACAKRYGRSCAATR